MVQTVNLDENEHAVTMLRGLKQMKHEEDLCDFIIKVGSDEYQTHKNVLSVGSPYFKELLKSDAKESQDGKLELKDVDSECVQICIDFLYSGNFDIPDGKIGQLLHVAIMLQLDKVKNAISDNLEKSVRAENFYETRDIAILYGLETISEKCMMYFEENIMTISAQPRFQNEEKSHLINILKLKTLKLKDEDKLIITLRWVGDCPERKEDLIELIALVKLTELPLKYLNDLLKNNPFISNDLRLYKLINTAYVEKLALGDKKETEDSKKDLIVLFDSNANCLQSYDPGSTRIRPFHYGKFKDKVNFRAIMVCGYIYILRSDQSFYRLNLKDTNSKWEKRDNMRYRHGCFPPVVSLSGSLFVIGSSGSISQPTSIVERYYIRSNEWKLISLQGVPQAISDTTLVSMDEFLLCIGGWTAVTVEGRTENRDLNSLFKYTPYYNEWVSLEPMRRRRRFCGAIAVEERLFVMGGMTDGKALDVVECFNIPSGQWTYLSCMKQLHGVTNAHYIDDCIVVVSRFSDSSDIEKYSMEDGRWSKVKFDAGDKCRIYESVSV